MPCFSTFSLILLSACSSSHLMHSDKVVATGSIHGLYWLFTWCILCKMSSLCHDIAENINNSLSTCDKCKLVCHQLNCMSTPLTVVMYTVLCSLHICWIICVNKEVWLHLSHAKYKLAMMTKSLHTLHNCKEKKPLITIAIHHCPHIHTVQTTDCVIYTAYIHLFIIYFK